MTIPTEPIGSIPRPLQLIEAVAVETAEEVRDRILEAAQYIPVEQLGTTDDCGFSPFSDDTSTTRDAAFEKIRARVLGTALAAEIIGR
jgi:5-methyltetrahydropteroyltriglutamate--homocysteine methyltransferase